MTKIILLIATISLILVKWTTLKVCDYNLALEKNVKEILENKTIGAQRFREYAKDAVVDWVTFSQLENWVSATLNLQPEKQIQHL